MRAVEQAEQEIEAYAGDIRKRTDEEVKSANLSAMDDLMLDHKMSIDLEDTAIQEEFDALKARVEALQERRKRLARYKSAVYAWEVELNRP
jgi:hypothetical protein